MINFKFWRKNAPASAPAPADAAVKTARREMKISDLAVLTLPGAEVPPAVAFKAPEVPPGVIPHKAKLACDSAMTHNYAFAVSGAYSEGLEFMGYAYLSELTQRPEYRRPAEILAKEMTREWIKLQAIGDDKDNNVAEKLVAIEAEMKRLGVQAAFQKAAEQDGYFGRSQIYLDTGATDDQPELRMPLSETASKIGKGMLKAVTVIEPIWTYPNAYNSTDPLRHDFFRPQNWFVMGKEVHASRLLTFVSRPVPDMLKPSYAFGGLSLSQIAKPYVDNWLRTRQSVSDLISNFSVMGLKTNLEGVLNSGGSEMMRKRAELFNITRNNRGLMMLDQETEDFFNVSAPLGSLDKLQAQSQEHMAAVTGIPLVILLGITPTGLNASSEGELETFYAWIKAQQEALFTPQLSKLINVIQLSLFGEIDPAIGFKYMPLWTLSEVEVANARKTEADTDVALITAGVITPDESRERLAGQEDGPYSSLELADAGDLEFPDEDDPPAVPAGGGGLTTSETDKAEQSLNGAQVTSMVDIVSKVGSGELTPESATAILMTAFPVTHEEVQRILAGAGRVAVPAEA